jgi:hypothetical protein
MSTAPITYCKIFPPLGIARLGNSPDEYFIGPESPGLVPDNGGSYKDSQGRVKRQGARFRVYGFDESGKAVAELTTEHPEVSSITWHVTLANKKAQWFQFDGAKNVAGILNGEKPPIRNANVKGDNRKALIAGPISSHIEGRSQEGQALQGEFRIPSENPASVLLGQLQTDPVGRLIVLGGAGTSESVIDDNPLRHYANNDGWHDDTSDGPVTAAIKLKDGSELPVRGRAWVIVAPPHFSPYTENVVTLYDVIEELSIFHELPWVEGELGPLPNLKIVSFTHDIYPILRRLTMYQWISKRAHRGHARGKDGGFLDPDVLKLLSDPDIATKPRSPQKEIFSRVRTPILFAPFLGNKQPHAGLLHPESQEAINQANLFFMPPLAGDEGDVEQDDPSTWLSLTEMQYEKLRKWKDGEFVNDWNGNVPQPVGLEQMDISNQPAALTRAALEICQGGAFYPGIEITSIVRFKSFYSEAFRVSDTYEPGDITKWMALPWQADFYECRDHWWPSIRPDDVVPVGEYEEIIETFKGEAERARLASLLVVRKPWARGIALELPPRPGLPVPREGESTDRYQTRSQRSLNLFANFYVRIVRGRLAPLPNQDAGTYRRRVEEFLNRTILDSPVFQLPQIKSGESLPDYHVRVTDAVAQFIRNQTVIPAPDPDQTLKKYLERLGSLAENSVWQGLFDVEWRRRVENFGKDELAQKWSGLGFVVPRTKHEETVFVETDRGRFDMLSFRDYFYLLMNIEQYPEFLPKAMELAEEYLRKGREVVVDLENDPRFEQYGFFPYDETTFQARLEKIYEAERVDAERYNPVTGEGEPLFRSPAQVIERIRQLAPFNQLDGSWLERATKAGPISDINSFLFEIWSDEIGNGDPAQNHANVYTDLMHSAGIYLPALNSRAYADHPDFWESSFSSPAYQAAISRFPESFYPELLGMTLYLEWEAIYLPAMVKLYDYHGYNSLFYRLHVAIDNPVNGHGARAREAVIRYLDHVRAESGETEMQEHWRRIWTGYLAFKFVGGDEWQYRFTNPPTLDEQMRDMILEKRHYGQLNHNTKKLGTNSINDWFDEPDQFLAELSNSDLITKGDAKNSKIFTLMDMHGPMLKVFTAKERTLWEQWINSLPRDPDGGALEPGQAMELLINEFQARGVGVPDHGEFPLTGEFFDPEQKKLLTVTKPVSWWFQVGQPKQFMAALSDVNNGWIVPGNIAASRFVTELLSDTGRMARFLLDPVPELGNKPARMVITDWIAAGCPIPAAAESPVRRVVALATPEADVKPWEQPARLIPLHEVEEQMSRVVVRSMNARPLTPEQRQGIRRRFYGPGGGAAH